MDKRAISFPRGLVYWYPPRPREINKILSSKLLVSNLEPFPRNCFSIIILCVIYWDYTYNYLVCVRK